MPIQVFEIGQPPWRTTHLWRFLRMIIAYCHLIPRAPSERYYLSPFDRGELFDRRPARALVVQLRPGRWRAGSRVVNPVDKAISIFERCVEGDVWDLRRGSHCVGQTLESSVFINAHYVHSPMGLAGQQATPRTSPLLLPNHMPIPL